MIAFRQADSLDRRNRGPAFILVAVLLTAALLGGCTRKFYRKETDQDVARVLTEKNVDPRWGVEQYHVYPDPRARFADPTRPDHPPMPPDDAAAHDLSPNPQNKEIEKVGIKYIEGAGYLDLLAQWDGVNRAEAAQRGDTADSYTGVSAMFGGRRTESSPTSGYGQTQTQQTGSATNIAGEDAKPFLLKMEQALELGLINSREFQDQRENLYLDALPVTVERFAFVTQPFLVERLIRERTGSQTAVGPHNRWHANTVAGITQLFSTGALLLFRFANDTFIELTGAGRHTISRSTINLDAVQPLLQGGGKAVTLEPLTQSERDLLYSVRDYARFRKIFYVNIAGGVDFAAGQFGGPFGTGAFISGISTPLAPIAVPPAVTPGQGNAVFGIGNGLPPPREGFLRSLLQTAILANQRNNVAALEDILVRFRNLLPGSEDYSQLQVDQVEQQLLNGQTALLQAEVALRDSLDRFKLQLGLPPKVPLELDDTVIRPLTRQLRRFEAVIANFETTLNEADGLRAEKLAPELRQRLRQQFRDSRLVQGTQFRTRFPKRWAPWEKRPTNEITQVLRQLRQERRELEIRIQQLQDAGQPTKAEDDRLREVELEIEIGSFEQDLRAYERQPWKEEKVEAVRTRRRTSMFDNVVYDFGVILTVARNERLAQVRRQWPEVPAAAVGGVDLLTADADQALAVGAQTALTNRLDLMNARAQLVDAWRQIAVLANSLMGFFNIRYQLESFTPPFQATPFAFGDGRNTHRMVLDLEPPLIRRLERSNYRAVLIAYQRQRRQLMATEDTVVAQVRGEIRQLRFLAQNYRIQTRSVELAYSNVENARDQIFAPPAVFGGGAGAGAGAGGAAAFGGGFGGQAAGAALTTQLLGQQTAAIQAQNQLFTTWINYLVVRMQLYRDLELMPLDYRGVWLDELSTCQPDRADRADAGRGDAGAPGEWVLGEDFDLERLPPPKLLKPGQEGPPLPQP